MKDFNPQQFTSDTQSRNLKKVADSADGIANSTNATLVGANQSRDAAPQAFLSKNRGLDPSGTDFKAEVPPPADPKDAPVRAKGGKWDNDFPPKGSGEQHLDKKSFARPKRGAVDGRPAGAPKPVKPATGKLIDRPQTTFDEWVAAHSQNLEMLEDYQPSEDDLCGMTLDLLLDAAFNARFAKTSEDRYCWLDSAFELMQLVGKSHLDLAGDDS